MDDNKRISKDIQISKAENGKFSLDILSPQNPIHIPLTNNHLNLTKDCEDLYDKKFFSDSMTKAEIIDYYCNSILTLETILDLEPNFTADLPIEIIAELTKDKDSFPEYDGSVHGKIDVGGDLDSIDESEESAIETIYISYKLNVDAPEEVPSQLTELLGTLTKILLLLNPNELGL